MPAYNPSIASKIVLGLNRPGAFFICCSFVPVFLAVIDSFFPVYGVDIEPKLGLAILMKALADYPEIARQKHPYNSHYKATCSRLRSKGCRGGPGFCLALWNFF